MTGTEPTEPTELTTAATLARRLTTAHKSLTVALAAVLDVETDLVAIDARPHLTTPCHIGAHEACQIVCMCQDCKLPCQCQCHR